MRLVAAVFATLAACAFATELLIQDQNPTEARHKRILKLSKTDGSLSKTMTISGHRVSHTIEALDEEGNVFARVDGLELCFSQGDSFKLKADKTLEVARLLGRDFEQAIQAEIDNKSLFVRDPRYDQITRFSDHFRLAILALSMSMVFQNYFNDSSAKNSIMFFLFLHIADKYILPMLVQMEESQVRRIDQERLIERLE